MTASIRLAMIGCLGGALLLLATGPAPAESWRVTIQGNGDIPSPTLVVAEVKGHLEPGLWKLRASEGDDSGGLNAESFHDPDKDKTFLVIPILAIGAKQTRTFTLERRRESVKPAPAIVGAEPEPSRINLVGQKFTVYHANEEPKPFYYPVIGPSGRPFTRAYPMETVEGEDQDHPHQRSMWFTHGSVNGFDFWASDPLNKPNPKFGSIQETTRKVLANGYRVAALRTTDDWLGPDGKKVCEDERTVLFSGSEYVRVIDFDITIKATAGPVTFGDTKEGMFGLRVASSMDVKRKQGGKITNAEGVTDNDAWGKASPWVDYTGPVEGKTVGIAILNHPESFRYPTTWHVRDYGLFAANPFGWHDFGMKTSGEHTIPAGQSIRFRYRVLLHTGETASANIPSAFNAFAKPPTVSVEKE